MNFNELKVGMPILVSIDSNAFANPSSSAASLDAPEIPMISLRISGVVEKIDPIGMVSLRVRSSNAHALAHSSMHKDGVYTFHPERVTSVLPVLIL